MNSAQKDVTLPNFTVLHGSKAKNLDKNLDKCHGSVRTSGLQLSSDLCMAERGWWLPDGRGSQAVPHLQQVVGVPHILCLLWHQSHLTEEVIKKSACESASLHRLSRNKTLTLIRCYFKTSRHYLSKLPSSVMIQERMCCYSNYGVFNKLCQKQGFILLSTRGVTLS